MSVRPHHFVQQCTRTGDWHVCHCIPGGAVASDGAARDEGLARAECARMNREHLLRSAQADAELEARRLSPADRPIPAGFYSDADAA